MKRETWGALLRDRSVQTVEVETGVTGWRLVVDRHAPTYDREAARRVAEHCARETPTGVVLALADVERWELAAILTPEELAEVIAATEAAAKDGGTDGR